MGMIVNKSRLMGGHTGAKARRGDRARVSLSVHPGPSEALPERLWGDPGPPPGEGSRLLASMGRATVGQVRTDGMLMGGKRIWR